MIEVIETKPSNLMKIKIINGASSADIAQIKPVLRKHGIERDEPRLIFVFSGLDEWSEVVKLWTDLNMHSEQVNNFTRIALVGREKWKGWLTKAVERMVDTDLKFFGEAEMEQAQQWVEQ